MPNLYKILNVNELIDRNDFSRYQKAVLRSAVILICFLLLAISLVLTGIYVFDFKYIAYKSLWIGTVTLLNILFLNLIVILAAFISFVSLSYVRLAKKEKKDLEKRLLVLQEQGFTEYEKTKRLREVKAEIDFKNNVGRTFLLEHLQIQDTEFFGDCEWKFRPGINILLGQNGYGKSLILRTLAALLQREDEKPKDLLMNFNSSLTIGIRRDGKKELIHRKPDHYISSIGKIPLLAIPDIRFLDRSDTVISPSAIPYDNLVEHGAYHFLNQLPYSGIINSLLCEIALDYWENGKSFNLPTFRFLEGLMNRMTGGGFRFSKIERVGREKFEIGVLTGGLRKPLPIQHASQGTLSILALFGLIRSFLKQVFGESESLNEKPSIVIIDEVDAHLHPKWQQKISSLLRESFPRVQFIISAHNPVVAAGCLEREVAVLRSAKNGFLVCQLARDFVGSSAQELYATLFDIDEPDHSLQRYPTWEPMDKKTLERLRYLDKKALGGELNALEDIDRDRLIREDRLRRRVADVIENRQDEKLKVLKMEAEIERLKTKIRHLEQSQTGNNSEVKQ